MDSQEARLELELPARPESVTEARAAIVRLARRCKADLENVATAVTEAVANVVRHAYRGRSDGTIKISSELQGEELVVEVRDWGVGMQPNPGSRGLGLGLALIGAMTRALQVETDEGGMKLSMRFPCPRAGERPQGAA